MLCLSLILISGLSRLEAQEADAYKFQPPPPPPLSDTPDFDELEDDGFEADDEGFRPPPPPPIPAATNAPFSNEPISPSQNRPTAPPPVPDFRNNNASYISTPGKFRFRIVDGEYWEKGKKRSRGRQMHGRSAN